MGAKTVANMIFMDCDLEKVGKEEWEGGREEGKKNEQEKKKDLCFGQPKKQEIPSLFKHKLGIYKIPGTMIITEKILLVSKHMMR